MNGPLESRGERQKRRGDSRFALSVGEDVGGEKLRIAEDVRERSGRAAEGGGVATGSDPRPGGKGGGRRVRKGLRAVEEFRRSRRSGDEFVIN